MRHFIFIIFILVISIPIYPQTTIVGGNISGFWDQAGSPYLIEGDIIIPDGETLTINAGCLVEFQEHYRIDVRGRLLALGTETDSIKFTINDTTGFHLQDVTDGGWDGIHFDSLATVNDSSKIKYSIIEYGKVIGEYHSFYSRGGAIRCHSEFCQLLIENCHFRNNYASGCGGAVYSKISNVRIIENLFDYNISGIGGAISISSSGEISNNNFLHNRGGAGGALNLSNSSCLVSGNRFSNNSANYGGAISFYDYNNNGSLVVNNLICNNSARNGAGCYFYQSSGTLVNNTIVHNYGNNSGGLYFDLANNPVNIYNTILYGNESQNGPCQVKIDYGESNPNFYNCNIQGGLEEFIIYNGASNYTGYYIGNIDYPPLFVDPSDGVGDEIIDYTSNWSLISSSVCVNHGLIDSTSFLLPEYDFLGNPRIYQGLNAIIDIGAYEYQDEPDPIPGIFITPKSIDFGIHTIYSTSEVLDINISNIGFSVLSVNSINAPAGFLIKRDSYPQFSSYISPFDLEPFSNEIINVIFEPTSPGIFDDNIVINSNDELFPVSYSNVKGLGEYWPVYAGNIENDTFWDTDTVKVIDSIVINDGVTLNISPSTVVRIFEGCTIDVQGTIIAEGTIEDSIIFTCDDEYRRWGGIDYYQTPEDNDSSLFSYCSFSWSKSSPGGAIYLREFSKLKFDHCTFKNNLAYEIGRPGYGGALALSFSSPIINNCSFLYNTAKGNWYHPGHGGAIYSYQSLPIINNCDINNNYAYHGDDENNGGGIYCEQSTVKIFCSTISNNRCEVQGAGIYCMQSNLRLESSLIIDNENGGGFVSKFSPNVKILNSTISNNQDDGLSCDRSIDVYNTIFWGNTNQVNLSHYMADPNFYNCNIEGDLEDFTGEGVENYNGIIENNIDENPNFEEIDENPYQLSENSPCIDSGILDTSDLSLLSFDIIGNDRIWDGNYNGTSIIDIGCYEYGAPFVNADDPFVDFPEKYQLSNYPNPFNPTTTISYNIAQKGEIKIEIYNIKGQKIKTLVKDKLESGLYSTVWNGKNEYGFNVSSGIYFCKLKSGNQETMRKMILIK